MSAINAILILGFVLLGCQKKMNSKELIINKSLNAPLHNAVNLKKLDSKRIVTTIQYQLLINLNLTLLEYDKNANLNTLLAEDYDIVGNTIVFQIKKAVKTISGHEIKAIDAELSLKRLIKSKDGSHSNLADLLCSEVNVNDGFECPGISSNNYELKINARKKSYIPFILSLLTNADNVIIPLTALDNAKTESQIVNFRETSGPYYIDLEALEDRDIEHIKLVPNKKHFLYSDELPQEINYTKTDFNTLVLDNKKLKKDFNYIHNISGLKLSQVSELQKNDPTVQIYPTLLLKNTIILSTAKGRKDFTKNELMFYELRVKDFLLNSKNNYPNILEQQIGYFPLESEGNLTSDQYSKVLEKYSLVSKMNIKTIKKIRLGLYKILYERYKKEFESLEGISLKLLKSSPLESNTDEVDIFIDTIDSSFTESLDLLQYNKTFGIFDVTDDDMKNYIETETKEGRIKQLQNIHFKSIMNAYFVNVGVAPYYTILSEEWSAEPSKFFVGFPVWKIKRKI